MFRLFAIDVQLCRLMLIDFYEISQIVIECLIFFYFAENTISQFTTTIITIPLTTNLRRSSLPSCLLIPTNEGGTHEQGLKDAILKSIRSFIFHIKILL